MNMLLTLLLCNCLRLHASFYHDSTILYMIFMIKSRNIKIFQIIGYSGIRNIVVSIARNNCDIMNYIICILHGENNTVRMAFAVKCGNSGVGSKQKRWMASVDGGFVSM